MSLRSRNNSRGPKATLNDPLCPEQKNRCLSEVVIIVAALKRLSTIPYARSKKTDVSQKP
ncbi:MAG: hypothetical protein ACI909_002650 [Planctomycetota bacterium]|jgi:hypothetical protein